jgi:tetratricopeptide (TPR) repeat protein
LILHLLTALAAAASAPSTSGRCPDVLNVESLVCRATEAGQRGAFRESAEGFERAAETKRATSAVAGDPEIDRLLAAAGNMWIAAGDPAKAAAALDKALSGTGLAAEQRGEALLDRARAAEAAGDLKTARAKVNEAMGTIAKDPFAWYFSAALALREGNLKEAERMIGEALALAPADPTLLFEAGHIAEANGDVPGARMYWQRAIERDPKGAAGRAAREALEMLPVPLTVTDRVAAPDPEAEAEEAASDQPKS